MEVRPNHHDGQALHARSTGRDWVFAFNQETCRELKTLANALRTEYAAPPSTDSMLVSLHTLVAHKHTECPVDEQNTWSERMLTAHLAHGQLVQQ